MKLPTTLFVLLVSLCAVTQQAAKPQLKLRILVDKEDYSLNEKVTVKAELTNLTSKTLCFPVPDQDCDTTATGFIVIEGRPVSPQEIDEVFCWVDERGAVGAELDSQIKERWIKLPPKAVYVTNPAKAQVTLNEVGNWRLTASYHPPQLGGVRVFTRYHPPQGSLSAKYTTILQKAARKAGCELPLSIVGAEPKIITVHN